MHSFKSIILKFDKKGDKTGWSYVEVPADIILKLKLENRKEFRIKGFADDVKFEYMTCYPAGGGNFIIVLNGDLRKKLGKNEGAMITIKFEKDNAAPLQSQELIDCLNEDPVALAQFNSMLLSQRNYFHRYVYTAKSPATKAGRIVNIINAMYQKQDFGAMIRSLAKK